MNKVILMGRLTRDPEICYTQGSGKIFASGKQGIQNNPPTYAISIGGETKKD